MGPVAGLVNAAQGQAMTNQLVQYSALLKPFMEAMEVGRSAQHSRTPLRHSPACGHQEPGKRVTREKTRADRRQNRRAEREQRWRERLRQAAAGEVDAVESPSSSSADEEEEEEAPEKGGGGGGGVLGFDASAVREVREPSAVARGRVGGGYRRGCPRAPLPLAPQGEVGEATVVQRERKKGGAASEKRHALWSLLDELEEEKAKLERERARAARYGIK